MAVRIQHHVSIVEAQSDHLDLIFHVIQEVERINVPLGASIRFIIDEVFSRLRPKCDSAFENTIGEIGECVQV
jgi:hypothetical protein